MMKGDPIPPQDHVSRYCSPICCTEGGQVTGVAFRPRENDRYLSVNWLEILGLATRSKELEEVSRIFLAKGFELKSSGKMAVLNVREVVDYVTNNSPDRIKLHILHDPDGLDQSHSGIYGYRFDDHLIADLIAETVQDTYSPLEMN
jgi:hypothetical protein